MDIRHFKLVSTIAEEGSLTKAAERLFLTQSALSHQLKEIESQLDTKVFERINKRLVLTGAGNILLRSSRVILEEIEKSKREINQHVRGETGEIRLSTECYTCYHWLPFIIRSYQADYPNVEINIKTDYPRAPLDQLLAGKLDIAIVYGKKVNKNIEYVELFTDELVAVMAATNPLSVKETAKPEDFSNQHVITASQKFDSSRFRVDFLKPKGVYPKKVTYVQLSESIIEMVKAGLGISVMANWLLKPYLPGSSLTTVRLGPRGLKYRWYIAVLKDYKNSEYMNSFVNHLKVGIFP